MHEITIETYHAVVDGDTVTEEKTDRETITIDEMVQPGQIGFFKSATKTIPKRTIWRTKITLDSAFQIISGGWAISNPDDFPRVLGSRVASNGPSMTYKNVWLVNVLNLSSTDAITGTMYAFYTIAAPN